MTISPLFTPSHVANFILDQANAERLDITQLKLLKLVYLSYGWVRAVLDRRLFEENIEAWPLGPVVPSLYHEFKRFRNFPITERSINMIDKDGQSTPSSIPDDDPVVHVMKKSWDVYKLFKAYALVSETHEPDSPWAKHYNLNVRNVLIPDDEIKEYFVKKITEYIDGAS